LEINKALGNFDTVRHLVLDSSARRVNLIGVDQHGLPAAQQRLAHTSDQRSSNATASSVSGQESSSKSVHNRSSHPQPSAGTNSTLSNSASYSSGGRSSANPHSLKHSSNPTSQPSHLSSNQVVNSSSSSAASTFSSNQSQHTTPLSNSSNNRLKNNSSGLSNSSNSNCASDSCETVPVNAEKPVNNRGYSLNNEHLSSNSSCAPSDKSSKIVSSGHDRKPLPECVRIIFISCFSTIILHAIQIFSIVNSTLKLVFVV